MSSRRWRHTKRWLRAHGRDAAVVAGAVAATGVLVVLAFQQPEPPPDTSSASRQQPISLDGPADETVVVALGDSFTGGSAMNTGPTWVERLGADRGWIVGNESVGGSGYTLAGPDGPSFPDRAPQAVGQWKADLVILAGGINDAGRPLDKIEAGARKTLAEVERVSPSADVVMLSPFASGEPTPEIEAVDARLRTLAEDEGVPYVNATGFLTEDLIGSDGVHPVDRGHVVLAEKVGAALSRLNLPRAHAYAG